MSKKDVPCNLDFKLSFLSKFYRLLTRIAKISYSYHDSDKLRADKKTSGLPNGTSFFQAQRVGSQEHQQSTLRAKLRKKSSSTV